ncbi:MAG: hypothetical protein Q7R54_01975 [bacterium]|nr:hypothetical protein [bacterium]
MELSLGDTVLRKGHGPSSRIPVTELNLGDTFSTDEGTFKVVTRSAMFGQLGSGARIIDAAGNWHYILRYGTHNFGFFIEPQKSPFGVVQNKGSLICYPDTEVSVLGFDKVN